MSKKAITQERLKEVLDYSHDTGDFIWQKKTSPMSRVEIGSIAGATHREGYEFIWIDRCAYPSHSLAWLYVYGYYPSKQIDHINGVRNDNRIENLRAVTQQENLKNQKRRCTNTTGYTGVYWERKRAKWHSMISVNGRLKHIGYFHTQIAAVYARHIAQIQNGYHVNHGRLS